MASSYQACTKATLDPSAPPLFLPRLQLGGKAIAADNGEQQRQEREDTEHGVKPQYAASVNDVAYDYDRAATYAMRPETRFQRLRAHLCTWLDRA